MISKNCSIDEFVESVKEKEAWEVIVLAVDEATSAERMTFRTNPQTSDHYHRSRQYSNHLKQLIDYLRYTVKFKRSDKIVYHLYKTHWEDPTAEAMRIMWMPEAAAIKPGDADPLFTPSSDK